MIWLGPINSLNGLLSVHSRWCTGHESNHESVLLEKKVDMKYMQVNFLRNIARMTKRGSDIITD